MSIKIHINAAQISLNRRSPYLDTVRQTCEIFMRKLNFVDSNLSRNKNVFVNSNMLRWRTRNKKKKFSQSIQGCSKLFVVVLQTNVECASLNVKTQKLTRVSLKSFLCVVQREIEICGHLQSTCAKSWSVVNWLFPSYTPQPTDKKF